jgi:hypothetical protein
VLAFADTTELKIEKSWQFESWQTWGSGDFADVGMLCSPDSGPPWRKEAM